MGGFQTGKRNGNMQYAVENLKEQINQQLNKTDLNTYDCAVLINKIFELGERTDDGFVALPHELSGYIYIFINDKLGESNILIDELLNNTIGGITPDYQVKEEAFEHMKEIAHHLKEIGRKMNQLSSGEQT